MRTFTPPADTRFYAGVDLHARNLFVVVLNGDGQVVCARNLAATPGAFLQAVAPFREGLLVACECMHCWYWLADCCRDQHIAFVLGHAWAMKAVHGSKTKCDRKDAEAIARLLKGGNFPPAYAYPKEQPRLSQVCGFDAWSPRRLPSSLPTPVAACHEQKESTPDDPPRP
jgi:transposase